MKKPFKTMIAAVAGVAAAAVISASAFAGDITGAGATFPYPIYSKWAAAYKTEDRHRLELPVDRFGRRHRTDQGEDRHVRRVRHAA